MPKVSGMVDCGALKANVNLHHQHRKLFLMSCRMCRVTQDWDLGALFWMTSFEEQDVCAEGCSFSMSY